MNTISKLSLVVLLSTSVAAYNASIRSFPSNMVASYHGIQKREQIKFDDEVKIKTSPRVFGAK